jgi:hypothetical protein
MAPCCCQDGDVKMLSSPRARTVALAAGALVALAALGFCGLREYGTRSLHAAVATQLADASTRLRDALGAAAGVDPGAAGRLDEHADAIEAGLAALHRLRAGRDGALVDAAELYLVTARELLRRMASSRRYGNELAASTRALRTLAETADRRSGAWIGQAVAANERAERAYSDYRRTVDALASLLDALAEPRARLARPVDPAMLLEDELRAQAAERARDAGKRAAEALGEARRLATRR